MLSEPSMQWLRDNGFDHAHFDKPGRYDDSALILASRQGEKQVVAELVAAGADLNHRNMDGTNALWAAVVADSFDIADRLLAAGIDLNNLNDNGATALMYAASSGKTAWVEYLLARGADPTPRSLDGYDALDLASNRDILRLLRNAGRAATASVNGRG